MSNLLSSISESLRNSVLSRDYTDLVVGTITKTWVPAIVCTVLIVIISLVAYFQSFNYYTEINKKNHELAFIRTFDKEYGAASSGRKSLIAYLNSLAQTQKITPEERCLTNFYIMTANAASIFLPPDGGNLPVVSLQALSYLLRTGVRGFVFSIHEKLTEKGRPYILAVDPHPKKQWRQVSMNALPLREPLMRLRAEAFGEESDGKGITQLKNTMDPIFIFLNFQKLHSRKFYDNVAEALEAALKDYRLDYTWAAGRREKDLFTTDIQELMGRVIILSNYKAEGTKLEDYINASEVSGIKQKWNTGDLNTITQERMSDEQKKIKQHLTIAMESVGTAGAENNTVPWKRAHDLGIHMVAMNWFNRRGDLAGYRAAFGDYSFLLKPDALRYRVQKTRDPKKPGDEANMRGGQVTIPNMNLKL